MAEDVSEGRPAVTFSIVHDPSERGRATAIGGPARTPNEAATPTREATGAVTDEEIWRKRQAPTFPFAATLALRGELTAG